MPPLGPTCLRPYGRSTATREYFTADELLEEFDDPDRDFEHGSKAVLSGDHLIAYGYLLPRTSADPVHDIRYDGGVHPDFRVAGSAAN